MKMIELAIYQLYVVVLIALTGITRTVSDRNNPPRVIIPSSKSYLVVFENTANGTVISDLNAVDPGDTLICSPTPGTGTEKFVKVEESVLKDATAGKWMWNISLITELDRDHSPSQVSLFFNVEDLAGNIVNAKVVMIIADVNDNAPTLTGLPYTRTLPEGLAVSSSVFNFSSDDPDDGKGGGVKYSMKANIKADESDYNSTFELNAENGAVILKRNLDYETRSFYHFKVSAKDTGNPSCPGEKCLCKGAPDNCNGNEVDFYITVTDEEDTPPVFERPPYVDTVDENAPINFTILTVSAVDGDRGVAQPSHIKYSLSDNSVPFFINDNGDIMVSTELDADNSTLREKGGLYFFNVTATEEDNGQSTSTLVSITVKDVNDEPPQFNKHNFTASVLENTPKGVPLILDSAIKVSDIDEGLNSRFQIFIETTNVSQEFAFSTIPDETQTLLGSSSITITVNESTILDFESTKSITLKLIAREMIGSPNGKLKFGNQSSTAMITVSVSDDNDNSPKFVGMDNNTFDVPEDASIGFLIHTFQANDLDSGEFGQVIFSLENQRQNGIFNVSRDGTLTLASSLDREKQSLYFMVITAKDNPKAPDFQQRKSQLQVTVNVIDANDNYPRWKESSSNERIDETNKEGAVVTVLRATDEDIGRNGELVFSIDESSNGSTYFDVRKKDDGEAELFAKCNLTGHPGVYTLNITARDNGSSPLSSTMEMTITVTDINLDPPVFIQPNGSESNVTTIEVKEEEPTDSVLYVLKAEDEGKGRYDSVSYDLLPTSRDFNYFKVDRKSGNITIGKRLDREAREIYEIQVKAEDNGSPAPLSTSLSMKIRLVDIDDNPPTYKDISMPEPMFVEEGMYSASNRAIIGMIPEAKDIDLDPQICYYLCDKQELLHLDKLSRNLSLIGPIDREKNQTFDVKVMASSNCTDEQPINCSAGSTLEIQIYVKDVDDNPPKFTQKVFNRIVTIDYQVGTEVIDLKEFVTDEDENDNKVFNFDLTGLTYNGKSDQNSFKVKKSGSVVTNALIQADLVGYFNLKVQVKGKINTSLTDTADVKIGIGSNKHRVKLVFSKLPQEVNRNIDALVSKLSETLSLNITVGAIKTNIANDGTRDNSKTDAFIYARELDTGTFLSSSELQKRLDFDSGARTLLIRSGVNEAQGENDNDEDDDKDVLKRLFIILVTVMSIVIVAFILILIKIVSLYRRRLRAATTMAYVSPKEQEMYEHPGTNKYFTAGNPLFGTEIKAPEIEEDRKSSNSLDINAVDQKLNGNMNYGFVDPEEEQEVVLQIMDSGHASPKYNAHINHNNHLDKVLEEYDNSINKNTKSPAYTNGIGHNLSQGKNSGIPGLGQNIQEAVTRFSDGGLTTSKDSGFTNAIHEISTPHGNLEYTEI